MATEKRDYLSYLLRLWRATDSEGNVVWRASLESPGTRQRQGFASLKSLFEFLASATGQTIHQSIVSSESEEGQD